MVHQPLPGRGLDDHDADRVRDDVVQLRRDARTLVAHRQRGVCFALLLELAGALGQPGGDLLALSQGAAGAPTGGATNSRNGPESSAATPAATDASENRQRAGGPVPGRS